MANCLHDSRFFSQRMFVFGALLCILVFAPCLSAQESVLTLDPAQTKIEFTLPATAHTVHGRFKLESGEVHFDEASGKAGGAIIVDATSGESGSDGRDKKMHQEVIESPKFPEIVFTPEQVEGSISPQGTSQIRVSGMFRLRGQDHRTTLTVTVERAAGEHLRVATQFSVPYVEWGLKNPSTFILRVDKAVGVEIHAVGQLRSP